MTASKNVIEVSDSDFEASVLKSPTLTLVDFWAEWCGPCRMLAPTIEAIAEQYSTQVKICKMNVDNNPTVPTQFHIRGIPTVLFFKNGQKVDQMVGNQPKDSIIQTIQKHLK